MSTQRIIFMGTPEAAVIVLDTLITSRIYSPGLVITQPDKPVGRKLELTPPPVKVLARTHNIELWQPEKLSDAVLINKIKLWSPDIILVVAYGKIIPPSILRIPSYGTLNVHPSLLPRHRGPSPIQYTILSGDTETGVTIMLLDEGMDTGEILTQTHTIVAVDDTSETLSFKLFSEGAKLLIETLPEWLEGKIKPNAQDDNSATNTKLLTREDGKVKKDYTAEHMERMVRGLKPWPGAYITLSFMRSQHRKHVALKILKARLFQCEETQAPLSLTFTSKKELCLHTIEGCLLLEIVQPENKKPMSGLDFWLGYKN